MLTERECLLYRQFVDTYQRYIYPLLGSKVTRLYAQRVRNVIDMGTGPGYLSVQLAKRLKANIYAVDINPVMLSLAHELAEQEGLAERIHFQYADVHHLPFPDTSIDFIISYSCFHHWADPTRGLSECYRILAPEGVLLIIDTMPSTHVPQILHMLRRAIPEPEYFRFVEEAFSESHSIEEVTHIVKRAGISDFQVTHFSFDELDIIEAMDELEELDVPPFAEDIPENEAAAWMLQVHKQG